MSKYQGDEWSKRIIRFNKIAFAKLIPEEDVDAFALAKGTFRHELMEQLMDKYDHLYQQACVHFGEAEAEVEAQKEVKAPSSPEAVKAKLAYKKLSGVLSYQVMKEEVLVGNNYCCFYCDKQFASRSQWKEQNPTTTYPLSVRCNFKIVKYIEKKKLFDIKELITNPVIFDHSNYHPACNECVPLPYGKE